MKLTRCEEIAASDDDMPIWRCVEVGFDDYKNLVVHLDHDDYGDHRYDHDIYATVDRDETFAMAEYLRINTVDLPKAIYNELGNKENYLLVPSDIEKIFQNILEFVLDCGVHYRLRREQM